MSTGSHLTLYDAQFDAWLERHVRRLERKVPPARSVAPRRLDKIDVTALLRADFEPKALARLDALGIAT